jgi:transcription initiation factor TFIIB
METLWSEFKTPVPESSQPTSCIHCFNELRLSEDGFLICSNSSCSIMKTGMIDLSPEWNYYGEESTSGNTIRCGPPINPLLKESSIGCKVLCHGPTSFKILKVAQYAEWNSMPYKEKTRYDDFMYISVMANNASISKMIVNEACFYYTIISERQSFRGLNRDGIIAASIYIACRIKGVPRTSKEIASMFNLDGTSATKGCKNAMSIINELEKVIPFENKTQYSETNPSSFIERYCSKLFINIELTKLANFIALQIKKNNLVPENTPHSVAAGIIYLLSVEFNLSITTKQIHDISDTSEVTINKCYKKIDTMKHLLIPPGLYTKYKSL